MQRIIDLLNSNTTSQQNFYIHSLCGSIPEAVIKRDEGNDQSWSFRLLLDEHNLSCTGSAITGDVTAMVNAASYQFGSSLENRDIHCKDVPDQKS